MMFRQRMSVSVLRAIRDLHGWRRAWAPALAAWENLQAGRAGGNQPRALLAGGDTPQHPTTASAPLTHEARRNYDATTLMLRRLVDLLALLAVVFSPSASHPLPAAPGPRPTLVVFVTVDQMRADYFQRFDKQLTGGFRRLYDGGAFFLDAYQDHGDRKSVV